MFFSFTTALDDADTVAVIMDNNFSCQLLQNRSRVNGSQYMTISCTQNFSSYLMKTTVKRKDRNLHLKNGKMVKRMGLLEQCCHLMIFLIILKKESNIGLSGN